VTTPFELLVRSRTPLARGGIEGEGCVMLWAPYHAIVRRVVRRAFFD